MKPLLDLRIAHTWDGEPVGAGEIATMSVGLDATRLTVDVRAPYHDDPRPARPPGRLDGLWEHEVVELFLVGPDARYLELELGPHGHWLALALHGRRRVVDAGLRIDYRAERDDRSWRGRARVPVADLPPRPWRWNAFALHGSGDGRRHLAAHAVPGPHPDFHRIELFPAL